MSPQNGKGGGGAMGRYVLRHILRAPVKSLLCLLLAAVFMLGLMLIRVSTVRSENELENLYLTTEVTVDIVNNSPYTVVNYNTIERVGYIYPDTVDKLMETGYLSRRYVEAATKADYLARADAEGQEIGAAGQYRQYQANLYGTEYPRKTLSLYGFGEEITYFDGWDESVFLQSWSDWQSDTPKAPKVYPAVVSQALYETFQMEEGDLLRAGVKTYVPGIANPVVVVVTNLTVVGTHLGDPGVVLLPLESYRRVSGVDTNYNRVSLTVDPARNRQLEEFREKVPDIISNGGAWAITALYWDQELRQAIVPMEQVISLMKTLYPITLALSLAVAAGISILLSLLSAREAAILRVLGNSKTRCRAILCLQNILACFAGLAAGHLGAVVMAYVMLPPADAAGLMLPALGRAGLYLLFSVLGAVGASVAMTAKNPLELLQVKE